MATLTILNKFYNESVIISAYSNDYVLEDVDFGTIEANHVQTSNIDGYGSKVSNTVFEPRPISIIGWVIANNVSSVEQSKKLLRKLINPLHDLEIIVDKYKLKGKADNSIKFAKKMEAANNDVLCKFVIDITAYYPFWTYKNPEIVTESRIKGVPLFPLSIPENRGIIFGEVPDNDVSLISNEGDIDAGFELYIYAAEGELSDIKFLSETLNQYIQVDYTLEIFETMLISTVTNNKYVKVKKTNGETIDITNLLADGSRMFQLIPGDNNLKFTSVNSSNAELSLKRVPAFMEVYV